MNLVLLDVDSLDERDGPCSLWQLAVELLADVGNELVGRDKDESVGAFAGLDEIRLGDDSFGDLDARQVLDILVLLVELLRERSTFELCRWEKRSAWNPPGPLYERLTCSSNIHILTERSNSSGCFSAFCPTILAIALPQLPDPASTRISSSSTVCGYPNANEGSCSLRSDQKSVAYR